jgi:predicted aspartyl protease
MPTTKIKVVLSLALLASVSIACRSTDASPNKEADGQPAQIPFRLMNDSLIVVRGTIGGLKDLNIILDTGANPTIISSELAVRLDLHGNTESSVTIGGAREVQSVIVPSIDIGKLHMVSSRVVVQDLRFVQRTLGISIQAIAGLDVLSTRSWMVDYRNRKILFITAKAQEKSVQFESLSPCLTVKANIAGQNLRLLVDSGTPRLLLYSRVNFKPGKLQHLTTDRDPTVFGAAGTVHAAWFRAPEMSLGDNSMGSQILLIADADSGLNDEFDGLLGLAQTGFHRVWLDFENASFAWD